MRASSIREFGASTNSTRIATGLFERTIQIWDLASRSKVTEIETHFCFGAKNLALAPDAGILVTGLSTGRGRIEAFDVQSGRKLWEARLTFPSHLRFDPTGQFILCLVNRRSVLRLDAHTGAIVKTIGKIAEYIEGAYGAALTQPIGDGHQPYRLSMEDRCFTFNRLGFALLDAQFSPYSVCVTEANGPVRCFRTGDGQLLWTYKPDMGSHVTRLHYFAKFNAFLGVQFSYQHGGPRTLLSFDAQSDSGARQVCQFVSWEETFVDALEQFVTSAGEVRSFAEGKLEGLLDFPQRDYPDK